MATKYPTMNWELPNTAEAFKIFKQKLLLVCEDNEIKEDNKIARKIMIGIDDEGLKCFNASNLTEEDEEKPAKLWKFFEDQLRVFSKLPNTQASPHAVPSTGGRKPR